MQYAAAYLQHLYLLEDPGREAIELDSGLEEVNSFLAQMAAEARKSAARCRHMQASFENWLLLAQSLVGKGNSKMLMACGP